MAFVKRMAYVEHSTQQMYELVVNVNGYSDFLPWCSQSKIIDSIEKKPNPGLITKFIDTLENKSFIFDFFQFEVDYGKAFYFDSNLVDVEITEKKMKKFLVDQKDILENLSNQYLVYMRNYYEDKHE